MLPFGALRGAVTLLAYLAVGFAGLPVFAEGNSGLGILTAPSAGYLLGMVAAAVLVEGVRAWLGSLPAPCGFDDIAGQPGDARVRADLAGVSLGAGVAER